MADQDEYRERAKLAEKEKKIQPEVWGFMKLTKIKGIGKERAKDIGRMFSSEEEFIKALNENKVGLRNDVVKLLKLHFQLNKTEDK